MTDKAVSGAQNLLINCVGLDKGETILLVSEEHGLGYFDDTVPLAIAETARHMGATVLTMSTPRANGPDDVPEALGAAMLHVDHTVFMNRIGDQMRFRELPGHGTKTMIYTLDDVILGSDAALFPHLFMKEMVGRFNSEMATRRRWRVTCPAGTDVSGDMPEVSTVSDKADSSFSVNLFPICVHRPVPANSMNGQIVLNRFVTGTNTHAYSPEVFHLESPITVTVADGHAVDLHGDPAVLDAFRTHSKMVAELFDLDETQIHSWHAGLNPGTIYNGRAVDDPVRWNGMIFGSPRHLHFHTCGDYPPGEINWHVIDPTVSFDGEEFIRDGEVRMFLSDDTADVRTRFNITKTQLRTNQSIGL